MRLAIGTALNLQVLANATGTPLNARVLGMLEGSSIIAQLISGPDALQVGQQVAVRCLEGRSISGFTSTVIELCSSPYPYFHLSYPRALDRVEVRQSERVSVAIPVTIRNASGKGTAAEVRDLSASGALLIASASIGAPGEHVELALPLISQQMNRTLQLKASVRNSGALSQAPGAPSRYRCGLQFLDVTDADRLILLGFVYERLSAARGYSANQPEPSA
jgi:c-di-GMP-binding flagellar brake protein YcgR